MRTLIVEDDKALSECMVELCECWKLDCYTVHTLKDGLEAIKSFNPQIIFLDLLLNGEMGTPLLVEAKKMNPRPCIILCSALRGANVVAEEFKPDFFITKPFDIDNIEEIITKKCL